MRAENSCARVPWVPQDHNPDNINNQHVTATPLASLPRFDLWHIDFLRIRSLYLSLFAMLCSEHYTLFSTKKRMVVLEEARRTCDPDVRMQEFWGKTFTPAEITSYADLRQRVRWCTLAYELTTYADLRRRNNFSPTLIYAGVWANLRWFMQAQEFLAYVDSRHSVWVDHLHCFTQAYKFFSYAQPF